MKSFPRQRLSYQQKSASSFKWAKEVIDYIVADFVPTTQVINKHTSEYQRKLSNYQLYNNLLNQEDFERACNPLGINVGQFQDEIEPYNKTYNKIQVLLSEELRRPFDFSTFLLNPQAIQSKASYVDSIYRNYIYSQLQQTLQQSQALYTPEMLEQTSLPIIPPEQVKKYVRSTYREAREVLSSELLEIFARRLDLPSLKNDAFKHALISGEEFVYVGISPSGEPYVEVLNPLGIFYHKSPETKWIQDSLYAGYRTYMTVAEVLDKYGPYLSETDLKKIDQDRSYSSFPTPQKQMEYHLDTTPDIPYPTSKEGSYSPTYSTDILVQHVEWRSQQKVGFLTTTNSFGDIEETIVSEDYKIPPTATRSTSTKEFSRKITTYSWVDPLTSSTYSIEWGYLPQIWTGTLIGKDIYTMIGPKPVQYRSSTEPLNVQLGYHGVVYSSMNADPVSLMDRMKPFQYLYLIVMHKLKLLIAQDQGKVFALDYTMIEPSLGWEKTLYFLKSHNLDIYNPLMNGDQPGSSQRGKVTSAIDMSNMQNISAYVNLLQAIDNQISQVAGVTPQREGQVGPTEAVGNAQTNIQMSAVITEIYFETHRKLWEKVLNSLIHVIQRAYSDRPIALQHVLSDRSLALLYMDPTDLTNFDIGVYVSDSGKEAEMFQSLKAMADGLLNTNRARFSDIISLYEASSLNQLKEAILLSEEKLAQEAQASTQAQIQAQQELEQSRQEFEFEKQAREHENKLALAEIESFKFQRDQDLNNNQIPDQLEIAKLQVNASLQQQKIDLEKQRLEFDKEKTKEELKIKKSKSSPAK